MAYGLTYYGNGYYGSGRTSTATLATATSRIAAGADDTYHSVNASSVHSLSSTANDVAVGLFSLNETDLASTLRFSGLAVPQGATVTSAYITLVSSGSDSGTTVNSYIHGFAADAFSNPASDAALHAASLTTAQVSWDAIPAWTSGATYTSPDISSIVQEVVNRAGWASGNALGILWEDFAGRSTQSSTAAVRRGQSYDNVPGNAPLLTVTYSVPSTVTTTKTQGGAARITAAVPRTQSAKARVTASSSQAQAGKARVTAASLKTQAALARLTASTARTQAGKASVSSGSSTTLTLSISQSTDDAYSSAFFSTYSDTAVRIGGFVGGVDTAGLRFNGVTIPQGTTITSAVLTVTAKALITGTTSPTSVYGEASDNAATFSSGTPPHGRTNTTATVSWTPSTWTTDSTYGPGDLASIITEIVGRGGWASGNSLALLIRGTNSSAGNERSIYDYTDSVPKVATLQITFGGSGTTTARTQAAVARITGTATRTQAAKARVTVSSSAAQTALARVTQAVAKTASGIARLTASTPRTQPGKARIVATAAQAQTAKARVTAVAAKAQPGVSRITAAAARTQAGIARITASTSRTATGISRVAASALRSVAASARISRTAQQAQLGTGRIIVNGTGSQGQAGKARVTQAVARTVTGTGRVTSSAARTQPARARVTASSQQGQAAKARITVSSSQAQSGKAKVNVQSNRDIAARARVTASAARPQSGVARITATAARAISAVASVIVTVALLPAGRRVSLSQRDRRTRLRQR